MLCKSVQDNIKLFNAMNKNISWNPPLLNKEINQKKITPPPEKEDLSNNSKFEFSEAGKNFWKGVKKPFHDIINYVKANPIQGAIMAVSCAGLTVLALSSPLIALGLTALGCYFIGKPLVNGINKCINAQNGDDYEKAFLDFGESVTYTALTFGTRFMPKVKGVQSLKMTQSGKRMVDIISNATDVASFGPRTSKTASETTKFLNLTRNFMRSGETSSSVGENFAG